MHITSCDEKNSLIYVYTRDSESKDIDARTVNFIDEGGITLSTGFHVRNYTAARTYDNTWCTGTTNLWVHGTFTPQTSYFYGCTMTDGSTIDLSGTNDTWSIVGNCTTVKSSVDFADNATVNVNIGGRSVANGAQLVSWTTAPTNLDTLTFKCISTGDPTGSQISLHKKSDGLYVWKGMILIVR